MTEPGQIGSIRMSAAEGGSSVFMLNGKGRYRVDRRWGDDPGRFVAFVVWRPLSGTATRDDRHISRATRLARLWGYGGVTILALTPWLVGQGPGPRSGDETNDYYITNTASIASAVVFACGGGKHGIAHVTRIRGLFEQSLIKTPCYVIDNPKGAPVDILSSYTKASARMKAI